MEADGGWPLHIDATGEDGRGTLFVALAGWRRWVLGSWKIPTEHSQVIQPCLHEIIEKFGAPCAVVRDLGRAITPAINTVLAERGLDIPVLACHMHFLKDIGKDLLNPAYGQLRLLFRRYKTRPKLGALARELGRKLGHKVADAREQVNAWQEQDAADHRIPEGSSGIAVVRSLTQWVIDYSADSTGHDYPFDRPYLDLFDRCITACRALDAYIHKNPSDPKVLKALKRLRRLLDPVASEVPFKQIVRKLRSRSELFDELKDALRLVPKRSAGSNQNESSMATSSDQAATQLRDIREMVIESFFRGIKHDERRRSGRKILTQDFECLPPEAALVYNLSCPDYVSIVCGSLERLPKVFARIDFERDRSTDESKQQAFGEAVNPLPRIETASLPSVDRKLICTDQMQKRIAAAAKSRAPYFKA